MEHMLSTTRFMSMKKNYIVILCILIFLSLCGCKKVELFLAGENDAINVLRINSSANLCQEDYYVYTASDGVHCCYLPEEKDEIIETIGNRSGNWTVSGEFLYYLSWSENNCEIRRHSILTKTDELVLSNKELLEFSENIHNPNIVIGIDIYGDNVWLRIRDKNHEVYVLTIKENEDVAIRRLLAEKINEDDAFYAECDGVKVEWSYDKTFDCYYLENIWEVKSGNKLFAKEENKWYADPFYVHIDEMDYLLYNEGKTEMFYYRKERELDSEEMECLSNSKFQQSNIHREYFCTEGDSIIGLMPVVRDWRESYSPENPEWDILFRLDTSSGNNEIIYDTKKSDARIVGYQNEIVYLVENFKVYAYNLEMETTEKLFDLEKGHDYTFDWQAGYMIVIRYDSDEVLKQVAQVYKVE